MTARSLFFTVVATVGIAQTCFAAPCTARAAVIPDTGCADAPQSDEYEIELRQGQQRFPVFVYVTRSQWKTNRHPDTAWASFDFTGNVTVRVRRLRGQVETCRILPSARNIKPRIAGNTVEFDIDRPGQFSVEFENPPKHPLLVFANPPETSPCDRAASDVLYFGPGVHVPGDIEVATGQTVYLARGAYVKGRIVGRNAHRVQIRGRGILSGETYPHRTGHLISLKGNSDDVLIEGITLVASPQFFIVTGNRSVIRNVKMMGWYFNTDGVGTGANSLVEQCFFKCNDDAVKLYCSNMIVRECVIWQMENGAPFQISWNMNVDNQGFHVSNIDIIRVEHEWNNENEAVFDSIHGGAAHMRDYLFENIRIENAHWRLINLTIQKNEFAHSPSLGRISDLVFRNIEVTSPMSQPNTIRGFDADHRIENVLFENVRVNGVWWRDASSANLQADPSTTRNIRFRVTKSQP
ncbi:hypothetical protein JCM19992_24970 [Thermostilla marina]